MKTIQDLHESQVLRLDIIHLALEGLGYIIDDILLTGNTNTRIEVKFTFMADNQIRNNTLFIDKNFNISIPLFEVKNQVKIFLLLQENGYITIKQ
jgi:hypothetical protein